MTDQNAVDEDGLTPEARAAVDKLAIVTGMDVEATAKAVIAAIAPLANAIASMDAVLKEIGETAWARNCKLKALEVGSIRTRLRKDEMKRRARG
jgi:hypothetical protein